MQSTPANIGAKLGMFIFYGKNNYQMEMSLRLNLIGYP